MLKLRGKKLKLQEKVEIPDVLILTSQLFYFFKISKENWKKNATNPVFQLCIFSSAQMDFYTIIEI